MSTIPKDATCSARLRRVQPRREWLVLALMVVSVFLNLTDRTALSVGAIEIQAELHLSHYQLGVLLSSFFWTYAIALSVSGLLVDKLKPGWVLAAGFCLWSCSTAVTGLIGSFATLFGLRLLLGVAESAAYPSYSKILASHFPENRRGTANSLIDASSKLGPAAGALLGGLLMGRFGWRPFFIVLGLVSLLWLVPWIGWMPREPGKAEHITRSRAPTVADILRQRSAWWSFAGLFCANYIWYMLISWLPAYLEGERRFPKNRMALFGSLSFLAVAVASLAAGWLSDLLISRGLTPTRVRKTCAGVGLAGSSLIAAVAAVPDTTAAMVLLISACVFYGIFSSSHFAMIQTIAGPLAVGRWVGINMSFANLAGVAAPWVTGWILQETEKFYLAFALAAGISLLGAGAYVWGLGPVAPVDFGTHSGPSAATNSALL